MCGTLGCAVFGGEADFAQCPKGIAADLRWSDALCGPVVSGGPASYTFNYSATPFSFAISRSGSNSEPIFNTAGTRLMFKVLWPDEIVKSCLLTRSSSQRFGTAQCCRQSGRGYCPLSRSFKRSAWLAEAGAAEPGVVAAAAHSITQTTASGSLKYSAELARAGVAETGGPRRDGALTPTRICAPFNAHANTPLDLLEQVLQSQAVLAATER